MRRGRQTALAALARRRRLAHGRPTPNAIATEASPLQGHCANNGDASLNRACWTVTSRQDDRSTALTDTDERASAHVGEGGGRRTPEERPRASLRRHDTAEAPLASSLRGTASSNRRSVTVWRVAGMFGCREWSRDSADPLTWACANGRKETSREAAAAGRVTLPRSGGRWRMTCGQDPPFATVKGPIRMVGSATQILAAWGWRQAALSPSRVLVGCKTDLQTSMLTVVGIAAQLSLF